VCVTLTKQAGFNEVEGKDVHELLECCDNDMSTGKLELPKAHMALIKLNVLMRRIIMIKKQQSVK
jgi:hypothetical protein